MNDNTGYELSISMREGNLEIVITGEVNENSVDTLHDEVIGTIQEEQRAGAVLCDISALRGHHDKFSAAYFRVRSIPPDIQRLPIAVVARPGDEAYQSFHETTAGNAGLSVKWFGEIEAARAWLKSMVFRTGETPGKGGHDR